MSKQIVLQVSSALEYRHRETDLVRLELIDFY